MTTNEIRGAGELKFETFPKGRKQTYALHLDFAAIRVAGLEFFDSLISAASAPQQAAGAAMAMCWAILPYVFARAAAELNKG